MIMMQVFVQHQDNGDDDDDEEDDDNTKRLKAPPRNHLTTPRSPINLSRLIESARTRGLCYPSAFLCQVLTKTLRRLSTEMTSFLTFPG